VQHVQNVAEAHLRAAFLPQAAGQRFLLSKEEESLAGLAAMLRPAFVPKVCGVVDGASMRMLG